MTKTDRIIRISVQANGLLCQELLNFAELRKNCRLEFENRPMALGINQKPHKDVGVLYNKCSMARGIYFDGRKMNQGEVRLGLSVPTSHSEICDFIRIVAEIKVQYRNIQVICDDMSLSMEEFVQGKENYLHFSLACLREICSKNKATIELISAPYTLTPKEQAFFAKKGTLEDFQRLLHRRQSEQKTDAGLEIITEEETGREIAIFELTAGFPTTMPLHYEDSSYLDGIAVDGAQIAFYLRPEIRLTEENFDYETFIQLLIEFGAEKSDENHLALPGFTEEELSEIAMELSSMVKI